MFKQYVKTAVTEIDTSVVINDNGVPSYLARDANNNQDVWFISVEYFKANYKEAK